MALIQTVRFRKIEISPTAIPRPARIVVVDDESLVLEAIQRSLAVHSREVVTFCNGSEAVYHLEQEAVDDNCVVLDLCMPEMDGGEILDALVRQNVERST